VHRDKGKIKPDREEEGGVGFYIQFIWVKKESKKGRELN